MVLLLRPLLLWQTRTAQQPDYSFKKVQLSLSSPIPCPPTLVSGISAFLEPPLSTVAQARELEVSRDSSVLPVPSLPLNSSQTNPVFSTALQGSCTKSWNNPSIQKYQTFSVKGQRADIFFDSTSQETKWRLHIIASVLYHLCHCSWRQP